jgi:hypothetical protein
MILNRNSPQYREKLWDACADGATGYVFCNLCGGRVLPTDPWDESHIGIPAAHDGNVVGIAHRGCNFKDNITHVIPMVAKTKRMRRKHIGAAGPGITDTPLPAGRQSNVTKKLNGKVEARLPRYGKHARAMAALWPHGREQ